MAGAGMTASAAGVGAGAGGLVAKGVANSTMKPIVGQTLSQAGGPVQQLGLLLRGASQHRVEGVYELNWLPNNH